MLPDLAQRWDATRRRTREIFRILAPEAFDMRPIPLRHPIRFYEGHLASFNRGMLLRGRAMDGDNAPELTSLFARGIDPLTVGEAQDATIQRWPERARVQDYIAEVDEQMREVFGQGEIDPIYLHTAIEHEEMHQETLMYLIHRLPHPMKEAPAGSRIENGTGLKDWEWVDVPGGSVRLGVERGEVPFGWDNEHPSCEVEVATFQMASRKVSNEDYLEFVNAGGYETEKFWSEADWRALREEEISGPPFWIRSGDGWMYRGLFEDLPLPLTWPVYVSFAEANAYCRWKGCRLPTEAEYQIALDRQGAPDRAADNYDFVRWNPAPVMDGNGGGPLAQLSGNGWEWTTTEFRGFPGFEPFAHYPGYSADFFDGRHFVLKGASPVTPAPLVRPSFRNWFQDRYRYAYTGFRCARDV
jgi:iron(II)-dependent oxidoreductase